MTAATGPDACGMRSECRELESPVRGTGRMVLPFVLAEGGKG
jgi:hypothetical protein